MNIEITATAQGRGRFMVRRGGRILCIATRQPLLDAARVLLAEGADPKARIQMRHEGSEHVALTATVGAAAGLTVRETPNEGPYLTKHRPYEGGIWLNGSPPSDLNDEPIPQAGSEATALSEAGI